MKADFTFRIRSSEKPIRDCTREFLTSCCGYRALECGPERLRLVRGSRTRRLLSLRIETWPTELELVFYGHEAQVTGLRLRYVVRSGFHLVGSFELAILEAEVAILQEYLLSGRRQETQAVVAQSRRPVLVAVMLNATLAVLVVAVIGLLAGYQPLVVGLVALAVGLMDGVTITAFADMMVEGARSLPRIKSPAPAPSAAEAELLQGP